MMIQLTQFASFTRVTKTKKVNIHMKFHNSSLLRKTLNDLQEIIQMFQPLMFETSKISNDILSPISHFFNY